MTMPLGDGGADSMPEDTLGTDEVRSVLRFVDLRLSEDRIASFARQMQSHLMLLRTVDGLDAADAEPALGLRLRQAKEALHD